MSAEGHFCWESCDEGPHGCVCGNDCSPSVRDYTPTTEDIRGRIVQRGIGWGFYGLEEFDRWLAAHDAEKRAEWEAEQGETEWEYGSEGAEGTEDPDPRPLADDNAYWPESLEGVREPNAEQAAQIVAKWNEGDPGSARLIRRRKAGPWLPVPGSTVRESDSGVRDSDSEESEGKA